MPVPKPMSFNRWQFWRGVVAAWVIFMILLVLYLTVSAVLDSGPPWGPPVSTITAYLIYGVPIGGIGAATVALIGSPVAWVLGRALAGSPRIALHAVTYLSFGVALGLAVIGLLFARGGLLTAITGGYTWTIAAGCAIAVAGGWSWTVWRSVREGSAPLVQR